MDVELDRLENAANALIQQNQELKEKNLQLTEQVGSLIEALEAMLEVEDEECWHDHHGYCQAHNLRCNDMNEPECQVMLAKQALAENKENRE